MLTGDAKALYSRKAASGIVVNEEAMAAVGAVLGGAGDQWCVAHGECVFM